MDFGMYIRAYPLFKSRLLTVNIKLTVHEALIMSIMTCACLALEFAPDTYLLKLQRLLNKLLLT